MGKFNELFKILKGFAIKGEVKEIEETLAAHSIKDVSELTKKAIAEQATEQAIISKVKPIPKLEPIKLPKNPLEVGKIAQDMAKGGHHPDKIANFIKLSGYTDHRVLIDAATKFKTELSSPPIKPIEVALSPEVIRATINAKPTPFVSKAIFSEKIKASEPPIPVKAPMIPKKLVIPEKKVIIPPEPLLKTTPIIATVKPAVKEVVIPPKTPWGIPLTKVIPKKKELELFPRKKQLLKQIDEEIAKAPDGDIPKISKWANQEEEHQKLIERLGTVQFKADGGMIILNTKQSLRSFRDKIAKEPQTLPQKQWGLKKKPSILPKKKENIQESFRDNIIRVSKDGYFSDGVVFVKGLPPKGIKQGQLISPETTTKLLKQIKQKDQPAKETYHIVDSDKVQGVSARTISSAMAKNFTDIFTVFESNGKEYFFPQNSVHVIKNRFPNATFGIAENGSLIARDKGEVIGTVLYQKPLRHMPVIKKMAEEAGFGKAKPLPIALKAPEVKGIPEVKPEISPVIPKSPNTLKEHYKEKMLVKPIDKITFEQQANMNIIIPETGQKITTGSPADMRKIYDEIVADLGWQQGKTIFDKPIIPTAPTMPPAPAVTLPKGKGVKPIPQEIEPLVQEAREYKTAEEYVKAKRLGVYASKKAYLGHAKQLTDFYNQAVKGIKEVKPPELPYPMAGGQLHKGKITNKGERIGGIQAPIKMSSEMKIRDTKGNTKTLPAGEEFTPYLVVNKEIGKPSRVVLQDGQRVSVSTKQFKAIKEGNTQLGEQNTHKWKSAEVKVPMKGAGVKSFPETVTASPKTTDEGRVFVEHLRGVYPIKHHSEIYETALQMLAKDFRGTKSWVLDEKSAWSAEKSMSGIILSKHYESVKEFDTMADIVMSIDRQARQAGQGIEALKAWSELSPESLLRMSNKLSKKYLKKELDLDFQGQLLKKMDEIKDIVDETAKNNAMREILNVIAEKIPATKGDWFTAYRYQNMLSNPLTTERNIWSGLFNTFITRPLDIVSNATYDLLQHPFNPIARDMKFVDVPKYYQQVLTNIPNAIIAAKEAYKQGFVSSKILDMGSSESMIESLRRATIPKPFTIVPRFMEAQDRFFSILIAQGEKSRLLSKGLSESEAVQQSKNLAEQYLFRERIGSAAKNEPYFVRALDSLAKFALEGRKLPGIIGHGWDWFVPFITTPANIAKQAVRYSPIGFIGKDLAKEQILKASMGTTVSGYGAILAMQGKTTWSPPKDEKARALWYAAGNKPYSIIINGRSYSMMYFLPYSLALALPAALKHYQTDSTEALSDNQIEKIGRAILGVSGYLTTQTSLNGMEGFLKVLEGDFDYTTPKQLGFVTEQILPLAGMVRYINSIVDPIFHKTTGFAESMYKDYPPVGLLMGKPLSTAKLPAYKTDTGQIARREAVINIGEHPIPMAGYPIGTVNESKERQYQLRKRELQRKYAERKLAEKRQ